MYSAHRGATLTLRLHSQPARETSTDVIHTTKDRQDVTCRSVVTMTNVCGQNGKPDFWARVFRILDGTDLLPAQRLALLVIMIHEGENDYAFPAQSTIARRVGVGDRQVRTILKELSSRGFIITESRPGKTTLSRVEWGKFGTNPGTGVPDSQNASPEAHFLPTPEVHFLPPRKPTSYEHKENTKLNVKGRGDSNVKDQFVEIWNQSGLTLCRKLTDQRKKILQTRLADADWKANWREALDRASKSSFCRGTNERGWRADVDWFLRSDTVTKILEGKYDDSKPRTGQRTASDSDAIMERHTAEVLAEKHAKQAEREARQSARNGGAS